MPTCAAGHDSATDDYCDTCGTPIGARSSANPPPAASAAPMTCPACGAPRDGRFCEECGHDAALPAPAPAPDPATPPSAAVWTAVVRADRAWFDEVRRRDGPDAGSLEFPQYCPERTFELTGAQVGAGVAPAVRTPRST